MNQFLVKKCLVPNLSPRTLQFSSIFGMLMPCIHTFSKGMEDWFKAQSKSSVSANHLAGNLIVFLYAIIVNSRPLLWFLLQKMSLIAIEGWLSFSITWQNP